MPKPEWEWGRRGGVAAGLIAGAVGIYIRDLFALAAFAAGGALFFRVIHQWPAFTNQQARRRRLGLVGVVVAVLALEVWPVSGILGWREGEQSLAVTVETAVRKGIADFRQQAEKPPVEAPAPKATPSRPSESAAFAAPLLSPQPAPQPQPAIAPPPPTPSRKAANVSDENRAADFIPAFFKAELVRRKEGENLAWVYLRLHNTTNFPVENLRIQHQHRHVGWSGFIGQPEKVLRLPPKSIATIRGSADTRAVVVAGQKMYFGYRADWDNPDATPGCKVFFVEFSAVVGDDVGKVAFVGRVLDSPPQDLLSGFVIEPCVRIGGAETRSKSPEPKKERWVYEEVNPPSRPVARFRFVSAPIQSGMPGLLAHRVLIKTDTEIKEPAIDVYCIGDVFDATAVLVAGSSEWVGKVTVEHENASAIKIGFGAGAVLTPDATITVTLSTRASYFRVHRVSRQIKTIEDVVEALKEHGLSGKAVRRRKVEE